MPSMYSEYSDPVSIDQIEQAFFSDRNMYLHASLSDIFRLEIHHADGEDAEEDDCELFMFISSSQEDYENGKFLTLTDVHAYEGEEAYVGCSLEDAIRHFKLDRSKALWSVEPEVVIRP